LMMTSLPTVEAARAQVAAAQPQRIRVFDVPMTAMSAGERPAAASGSGSGRIRVSGTKWVIDGTPVERLMFMRKPYSDRGDTRGQLNFPAADLTGFLRRALAAGEQPMLHAVGDAAIDTVLDGLEQSGAERWQALRPRIEHGDMLEPSQFARAKRFGGVLVQNPSHFMISGIFRPRLGPRVATATLLRSTIAAGIPMALGSDGPLNPFLNVMFASINANNPAESMTREQALAAYTHGSAFAEFQEKEKGAIAAGMLADLAVLSQDILTVPPDALPATTSVLTIVGGRVVHEQKSSTPEPRR
jgi:predicted amidohydrolase YtcJ